MQDSFEDWVENIYLPSIDLNTTFEGLFPDVDVLTSCISTRDPANGTCPFLENAHKLIDDTMQELTGMVNIATENAKILSDKADEYKDNVYDAYQQSKAFYEGVSDTVARLSLDTSDWGGWYDIPLDSMFPVDVGFPDAIAFEEIPNIDGVWPKVMPALDSLCWR